MFRLDVRDDGHRRRQLKKRSVELIRFSDQVIPLTQSGVALQTSEFSPDDKGRIEPALLKDEPHHRCGRRLAVCACDSHALLHPHELAQHLGPPDHWNLQGQSRFDLRIVLSHGRRDNDHVAAHDLFSAVSLIDHSAQAFEAFRKRRKLAVRSCYSESQVEEHLCDPAHPNPADAHKMDPARPAQQSIIDSSTSQSSVPLHLSECD